MRSYLGILLMLLCGVAMASGQPATHRNDHHPKARKCAVVVSDGRPLLSDGRVVVSCKAAPKPKKHIQTKHTPHHA